MTSNAALWGDIASWLIHWHQRRQELLAARTVPQVARLWRGLDYRDLSGTESFWVESMIPVVERLYDESARASAEFVGLYGTAKQFQDSTNGGEATTTLWDDFSSSTDDPLGGTGDPSGIAIAPRMDILSVAANLLAAGPGSVRHNMPGLESDLMATGLSNTVGAVVEKGTGGGRDYVQTYSVASPKVVGWQRITDQDPCGFCALLASRGPQYFDLHTIARTDYKYTDPDEGDGKDGAAKVHYHCRCSLIPVFKGSPEPLSGWARTALEIWEGTESAPELRNSGWKDRRRLYRRRYDRFKAKNPNDGVEVDEVGLRRRINDALDGNTNYEEARMLARVKRILQ